MMRRIGSVVVVLAATCACAQIKSPSGTPNPACSHEGTICSGSVALRCDASGNAREEQDCSAQGMVCGADLGCVACARPGDHCVGTTFTACSDDGTILAEQDCFAEGQMCADGLGCRACVPGTRSCEGDVATVCRDDGSGYDEVETCDPAMGLHCDLSSGTCGDLCQRAVESNSYIGCDYFATTTINSVAPDFDFAVVVSNPQSVEARVVVSRAEGEDTYVVPAQSVVAIRLPWVYDVSRPYVEVAPDDWQGVSRVVRSGAYRLRSSVPVTMYQFNPLAYRRDADCDGEEGTDLDGKCFSYSNDASLLLPTHVLTGNYVVVARATRQHVMRATSTDGRLLQDADGNDYIRWQSAQGFAAIVGADDGPVDVEITSSAHTVGAEDASIGGLSPGGSLRVSLGPGDVLQLVSGVPGRGGNCNGGGEDMYETRCGPAGEEFGCIYRWNYCNDDADYDLTGTRIRANGRVAVVSGHECAFVPHNRWACDHLEESMFPLETWGRDVVVAITQPLAAEPNVIRIVSGAPGNAIRFEPEVHSALTLDEGAFVEFEASQDFRVVASEPVTVAQFMVGQQYAGRTFDEAATEGAGDPSFSLAIPTEQYRGRYSFLAPQTFEQSWVNLVAPSGQTVLLDGRSVENFTAIAETGQRAARVRIEGGAHTVESSGDVGVMVYGFGSYTSYMLPAGLDLRPINLM